MSNALLCAVDDDGDGDGDGEDDYYRAAQDAILKKVGETIN